MLSVVLLLAIMLTSNLVIAEEMNSNETESSSNSRAIITKTRISTDYDRDGKKIFTKNITEMKNGVEVERNAVTKIKDGKVVREMIKERRKFVDVDGKERDVRFEIRERMIAGKSMRLFKVNENGLEVKSELEISENESSDGSVRLRARLMDGSHRDIKVLPDRASEIAKARLRAKFSNGSLEIREIMHKNMPRAVYHLEGNSSGKFLGIFKSNMNVNIEIDAETGEVIVVNKPWWAFIVKQDAEVEVETNSSI